MRILTTIFSATLMLAALGSAARADALTDGPGTSPPVRSAVYYGDLNIDTEQGAKIMLQRIDRAAKKACGAHPTFGAYTHLSDHAFEQCRGEAVQRTVTHLGAAMVTRVYSEAKARESCHGCLRRATLP
jgi:UrcA family protein